MTLRDSEPGLGLVIVSLVGVRHWPVIETEVDTWSILSLIDVLLGEHYLPQGGMMSRFCFPLAATASSLATSWAVNLSYAARAPVKFASMRAGVTDFGSTTVSFATVKLHLSS